MHKHHLYAAKATPFPTGCWTTTSALPVSHPEDTDGKAHAYCARKYTCNQLAEADCALMTQAHMYFMNTKDRWTSKKDNHYTVATPSFVLSINSIRCPMTVYWKHETRSINKVVHAITFLGSPWCFVLRICTWLKYMSKQHPISAVTGQISRHVAEMFHALVLMHTLKEGRHRDSPSHNTDSGAVFWQPRTDVHRSCTLTLRSRAAIQVLQHPAAGLPLLHHQQTSLLPTKKRKIEQRAEV